jgi:hypothetical protein
VSLLPVGQCALGYDDYGLTPEQYVLGDYHHVFEHRTAVWRLGVLYRGSGSWGAPGSDINLCGEFTSGEAARAGVARAPGGLAETRTIRVRASRRGGAGSLGLAAPRRGLLGRYPN